MLASALSGNSPHAFTCRIDRPDVDADPAPTAGVLTPRAVAALTDLRAVFGDLPVAGSGADGGGRAVDVRVPGDRTRGWAVAHYLVSQAERLGVSAVAFDGRVWTARDSASGWRTAAPTTEASRRPRAVVHLAI